MGLQYCPTPVDKPKESPKFMNPLRRDRTIAGQRPLPDVTRPMLPDVTRPIVMAPTIDRIRGVLAHRGGAESRTPILHIPETIEIRPQQTSEYHGRGPAAWLETFPTSER